MRRIWTSDQGDFGDKKIRQIRMKEQDELDEKTRRIWTRDQDDFGDERTR